MFVTGGRRQRTRPEGAAASGRRCDHRRLRSPATAPGPGTAPARLPRRGRGEPRVPGPAVRTMKGPQLTVGRKKRDPSVPTNVSPDQESQLTDPHWFQLTCPGSALPADRRDQSAELLLALRRGADRAAVGGSALVQGVAVGLPAVPDQPAHRVVGQLRDPQGRRRSRLGGRAEALDHSARAQRQPYPTACRRLRADPGRQDRFATGPAVPPVSIFGSHSLWPRCGRSVQQRQEAASADRRPT